MMIDIALAGVFIVIAVIIGEVMRLGIGKSIIVGMVRAFVQLIAVGYLIHYIFQLEGLLYQIGLLLVMSVVASFTAHRQIKGMRGVFWITLVSILIGGVLTLGILLLTGVIETTPRYLIPFGGMVIGNSMNGIILALERLVSSVKDRKHIVEAGLALGASPQKAVHHLVVKAVRASLIPRVNSLKIAGIIQLPGAFMGMLIAGAEPLEAVKLQIIVLYMIMGCVSLAVIMTALLAPLALFNKAEQLDLV